MTVRRTSTLLADGRELIYYDDPSSVAAGAVRELHDPRLTSGRQPGSEVRWDPLALEWVAVASHRQDRTFLPPSDQCPLCPSTADRQTEIPASDYDVAVFENRFPSFAPVTPELDVLPGGEPFPRRVGAGRCEVVCFTADHDSSFAALGQERVRTVMTAWADRTTELGALGPVEHVFPFENRGQEIGVTLAHPHGQIYGYPFVPPKVERMLHAAQKYRESTGRDLFADVIAAEVTAADRMVGESAHWVAFVPMAARWPFEVRLHPRQGVPDLAALSEPARDDFGPLYLDVLRRFDALFDGPIPYIAAWQQAPARTGRDLVRLHLQLFSIKRDAGKLKYLAGSESGVGAFVNDIPPERAAHMLRSA